VTKGQGRHKRIGFSRVFKNLSIRNKKKVEPRKRKIEVCMMSGGKVINRKMVQTNIPVISPSRKKVLKFLAKRVKKSFAGKAPTLETATAVSASLVGATGSAMMAIPDAPGIRKVGAVLTFVGLGFAIPSSILAIRKSKKDKRAAETRRLSEQKIKQLKKSTKNLELKHEEVLQELKKIRDTLKIKDLTPATLAEGLFVMHNVNPKYIESTIREIDQIHSENKNIPTEFAEKLAETACVVKEAAKVAGITIDKKQKYMASPMKSILYTKGAKDQIMASKNPTLSLFSLALAARGAMEPLPKSTLVRNKRK